MQHFASTYMKYIQTFMSTAIFRAKLYASFFLIYHLMKTYTAVKINEAVGKRVLKVSKIRYLILNNE